MKKNTKIKLYSFVSRKKGSEKNQKCYYFGYNQQCCYMSTFPRINLCKNIYTI